jgi:hypothetical protein
MAEIYQMSDPILESGKKCYRNAIFQDGGNNQNGRRFSYGYKSVSFNQFQHVKILKNGEFQQKNLHGNLFRFPKWGRSSKSVHRLAGDIGENVKNK